MFLRDILRQIFFYIDQLIYGFIGTVYNLFVNIAETTIFTEDIFDLFASKIYALLGIFMLFKVSFGILTYIINPDDFVDKNKGATKMVGNVILTLGLLILTPWIFSKAMDVQRIILRDNVIGKMFSTAEINSNVVADPGSVMAYDTFKAFYYLDYEQHAECKGIEDRQDNSSYVKNPELCRKQAFNDSENFDFYAENLNFALLTNSIDVYTASDLVTQKTSSNAYTMTYTYLISTLCGGAIVLILISFCFDVAVRSVKLGFLRVIAPIPIASRIIPKKGKDTFDKWVKTCVSTYLDLFIRLIAIYFALFVITQLKNLNMVDAVTGEYVEIKPFVFIFIVLGALLFAKQLPKLIEDLGFKMSGTFTLNPMNKLRQVPLAGAAATTGAAMLGGAITGGIAGKEAGHVGRGIWQGMMGARNGIKDKVSLMGDDKGKNPHALRTGLQSGYKTITGKDFEVWSPWKQIGSRHGEKEVNDLKNSKYALQGRQATLDAELQELHRKLETAPEGKRAEIQDAIRKNRSDYGKISKHIGVIDDQIKDVKRLYNIEESPQSDLRAAIDYASGRTEIDALEERKKTLKEQQETLNSELHQLYKKYEGAPLEEQAKIEEAIINNRKNEKEVSNNIDVLDRKIKDAKKFYKIEELPQSDDNQNQSQQISNEPEIVSRGQMSFDGFGANSENVYVNSEPMEIEGQMAFDGFGASSKDTYVSRSSNVEGNMTNGNNKVHVVRPVPVSSQGSTNRNASTVERQQVVEPRATETIANDASSVEQIMTPMEIEEQMSFDGFGASSKDTYVSRPSNVEGNMTNGNNKVHVVRPVPVSSQGPTIERQQVVEQRPTETIVNDVPNVEQIITPVQGPTIERQQVVEPRATETIVNGVPSVEQVITPVQGPTIERQQVVEPRPTETIVNGGNNKHTVKPVPVSGTNSNQNPSSNKEQTQILKVKPLPTQNQEENGQGNLN